MVLLKVWKLHEKLWMAKDQRGMAGSGHIYGNIKLHRNFLANGRARTVIINVKVGNVEISITETDRENDK